MADFRGKFVWYELMTSNLGAAEDFYSKVVGWKARDAGMPGGGYSLFHAGEKPVGGVMVLPDEARAQGARPGWIGYIAVDDVDATAAEIAKAGGKIHRAPQDIPQIGRFAVVGDPQGAAFCLFRGLDGDPPLPEQRSPGHIGWHELYTTDVEGAFAFYARFFGWDKLDALDMGPMGTYQLFGKQGEASGGMMKKPPMVPVPAWLFYFVVGDIDAAVTRVGDAGGRLLNGPMEVPGGAWIIQGLDPQGAPFALVGSRG